MARKTINIQYIVMTANTMLAAEGTTKKERQGICSLVEKLLLDFHGSYKGFRYMEANELPEGVEPGIVRSVDGNHKYPDIYRRQYYL